jgi:hypothetical protein
MTEPTPPAAAGEYTTVSLSWRHTAGVGYIANAPAGASRWAMRSSVTREAPDGGAPLCLGLQTGSRMKAGNVLDL